MNQGDLCARHYDSGEPVRILWQNGRILNVQRPDKPVPNDLWIAPALFDLQVNGYAGVDFQQDDLPLNALVRSADALAQAGCSRWFLTLISADWSQLMARLRHLRHWRSISSELRHAIAGWHIEGPFLSAEPGFRGAHDASVMIDPTENHIRTLREVTGDDPVLLTIAPERPGAVDAVRLATSLGMVVSLGHTDAPSDLLDRCLAAGARLFTHLGNGCPRTLDRQDNIVWRVLDRPELNIGLIPDRIHVADALFRLVHRAHDSARIFYVTDAMAAAGAPPGKYPLGRLELEVGADQVVRLPGQPNFAGSALRPIDGVLRSAKMLGTSWRKVWPNFSTIPAGLLNIPAGLRAGGPADFCLLRMTLDGGVRELRTFAHGAEATPAQARSPR